MRASHLLAAPLAAAASLPRQAAAPTKLLVGAPNQILVADFDGTDFTIVANATEEGTNPSWLAFREPNLLYAVDEMNAVMNLFEFDAASNTLEKVQAAEGGSFGTVHLEFNPDKTRLVASSYAQGTIDVWDITDGPLSLMRQINSTDPLGPNAERQDAPHPHQAVMDPTGRFFVVNDLGTDTLLVLDSDQDQFEVVNRVRVTPDGCGPRHGAFLPRSAEPGEATHYLLVCELLNMVEIFALDYADNSLQFVPTQVLSSFGEGAPPANASTSTAGEIAISDDGLDVYVSNRNTGNETDAISHFRVLPGGGEDDVPLSLEFSQSISSAGVHPRMFSLSGDGSVLFSTNQFAGQGLVALSRNGGNLEAGAVGGGFDVQADVGGVSAAVVAKGTLVDSPVAAVALDVFGEGEVGPLFVVPVPAAAE